MSDPDHPAPSTARFVLAAEPFDETLGFFTTQLGFRIDVISPADDPDRATVSRDGLTVVLDRYGDQAAGGGLLQIVTDDPTVAGSWDIAPNGTEVRFVARTHGDGRGRLPPNEPSLVVSCNSDDSGWVTGRAGMQYRDLIPGRQGGRFIASHIKVPGSGPVPDWVHHHDIRFQIIYCRAGAATLVYEDQGEPFRFEAGDCVLQPPGIRHQVLETFDDLQVIELGCPARHDTVADHDMQLPTGRNLPDRVYNGQRFVHHKAGDAQPVGDPVEPWSIAGWTVTDTGIAEATDGLGSVRVMSTGGPQPPTTVGPSRHNDELLFLYLLAGSATLVVDDETHELAIDDSAVIPPDAHWTLEPEGDDNPPALKLLEVRVSAPTGSTSTVSSL